jgi:hypothetical protein
MNSHTEWVLHIVGALFKIIHFELGPLTGTRMLAVGLLTEALFLRFPHLSLWIMS